MGPWQWLISDEHWKLLSPPSLILAVLGWLGRRRGWFRWADNQLDVRKKLASIENTLALRDAELEACTDTNARLLATIATLTDASAAVLQARQAGQLTISSASSPEPLPLPASSTRSPRPRKPGRRGAR